MIDRSSLHGILAMMPAFAGENAHALSANDTLNLDNHAAAVDRIVGDGIDAIATTGSFGEGYSLLHDEFCELVRATVRVVDGRVPVFAGCVGASARDIYRKVRAASEMSVDGVLVGLPNYFPLSTDNAVRFYQSLADEFSALSFLIYHNPLLFRTVLPIDAVCELASRPNIMGLKDSHRDARAFIELMERTERNLRVFVFTGQYLAYSKWGAAGTWSYECWMDPWPVTRLRDAIAAGDEKLALELTRLMTRPYEGPQPPDLRWRETAAKIAVSHAGYCDPGPLRAPFFEIPDEVDQRAKRKADEWAAIRSQVTSGDPR